MNNNNTMDINILDTYTTINNIVKDLIGSFCDVNLQETTYFINTYTLQIFLTAMNVRPATKSFNNISRIYETFHKITLPNRFDESPFYNSNEFKTFELYIKKIKNLDISYDKYNGSLINDFKDIIIFNTSDNTIYDKLKFIKEKVIERKIFGCLDDKYDIMMGDILGYGYHGIPPRNKWNYSIGIRIINDTIGNYNYFNFISPTEHFDIASDKVDNMVDFIKSLFQKISLDYIVKKDILELN
jgi:hypothetical protein